MKLDTTVRAAVEVIPSPASGEVFQPAEVESPMVDASEFPDGGRATLVRRYSPALTALQLNVLATCPYLAPRHIPARDLDRRVAMALVRFQLLERNPIDLDSFRVTEAGADVVRRWRDAGFLP